MQTLQIRLKDEEMRELRHLAMLKGVSPTRYATVHLLRGLQRQLLVERAEMTSGPPVVHDPHDYSDAPKVDEAALLPYTDERTPRATINWSTGRMDRDATLGGDDE